MADLTLTLGDITFTDFEVPERIPFGGDQMLVTHKLVGGQKTIDAMGPDEAPIEWEGWIRGQDAVARAQSIDAMRISGKPQTLKWSGLSYQVIVRNFSPSFERDYQIRYRIIVEVISNNVQPVTSSETPSLDDAVMTDAANASTLAGMVDDAALNATMDNINAGIAAA